MSDRQRIWAAQHAKGYAVAVAAEPCDATVRGDVNMSTTPLLSGWSEAPMEWHRSKKKDQLPDITLPFTCGSVCFRASMASALFRDASADLEFLAATAEGEDWLVLHCLRSTRAIDHKSSDLSILEIPDSPEVRDFPPTINGIRWINVIEAIALAERWEVFCVPASSHPMAYRHLLLTDVFVDRVRGLGLKGLEFKHVGYIVADASQAVPKPPAPPPPPSKPSKRKPPKLTSGSLPDAEQIEIAEVGAAWRQRLQLASDASAQTILQRITDEMQKLRPVFWTISAEERIDASLGLSAIYGELLHSACGWSWAELRRSRSQRWIAVMSASGNHALTLVPYIQQQMQSEAPTPELLFNMIVAGNLPPAEPGQPVLIG